MNEKDYLRKNERLDDLQACGYMLIQNPNWFCFGMDAVLLSFFAKDKIEKGARVLDLGTGNGVIPILLCAKTELGEAIGLEIQKESAEMAQRSVLLNNLNSRIKIICGDINNTSELFSAESFDYVITNPPYMEKGGGIINHLSPKAIARHEVLLSLENVVKAASWSLKYKGRFFMVHRPKRLTDIICSMRKYKLEPKTIRFVHPHDGKEPNLALIEGLKGGNPMIKVEAPLVVYNNDGTYTQQLKKIYYGESYGE